MIIDYSRFRFRAVVDWIEIEILTERHTNFQTVQEKLRVILGLPEGKDPYVQALEEGAGGRATVFRFRIYDPKNWHQVMSMARKLSEYFPSAGIPKVTVIEIAFDAYSKGEATPGELAELVACCYRNMTGPVSENRRVYKDYKGSGKAIPRQSASLARHVREDGQIGIGDVTDEHYQHIYLKTTDNSETLSVSDYRARLEIRLRDVKIPCRGFNEWESFRFESLSRFFRFRQIEDGFSPMMHMVAKASTQIGERKERRRAGGGTRLYSRATSADRPLNDAARYALRNLSERWSSHT